MIRIRDIAIHTCNTCQLACDWCYAADAPRKSGFNEYTDAVIDFMAQCSYCHGISDANSVVNVCFMGGEPLCHKDKIVACVERAKKLYPGIPMYFGCRTNMVDADRDFLRWAIDIGFNVGVSFDGCRKAHDAHRVYKNGSGSFDMVEKNILVFLEMSNGKVSHVRATAAPSTVRYMVDSYRYFKSIGIRDIVYGFTMNKPWNQLDVEAFQSSIQEIAEEIVKDYLGGHRFHFHNLSHPMRDAGMQGL